MTREELIARARKPVTVEGFDFVIRKLMPGDYFEAVGRVPVLPEFPEVALQAGEKEVPLRRVVEFLMERCAVIVAAVVEPRLLEPADLAALSEEGRGQLHEAILDFAGFNRPFADAASAGASSSSTASPGGTAAAPPNSFGVVTSTT